MHQNWSKEVNFTQILGKVTFIKGSSVDNDATVVFNSTYTVTLQRLKNPTPNSYFVAIGFKHLAIDIPLYPASILGYLILVQNKTSTSFGCLGWASSENFFTRYQISYMAISKDIGNVYFFSQIFTVNQALVYPVFADYTFTDPSIKQIGKPYTVVHSIYQFVVGLTTAAAGAMIPYVVVNSTTLYTIRLYASLMYISTIGIQGVIFDPIMLNDIKRKHIFLARQYVHSAPLGYFDAVVLDNPGIVMTPNNVFFGLYFFYTVTNNMDYQFNLANNQVRFTKQASVPQIIVHIVTFLRNLCPDPFTYVESKAQCMPCMANCLRCDGTQCFQCAQNFTLSTDATQCLCQKQLISGICYEFDQSPMKGCISAEIDSSEIKCKMCSSQQHLILVQNECQCINGYAFDSSRTCQQTCGDGQIFDAQCDDGNTLNGDGCSDSCKMESGFLCSKAQPTDCKFKQQLEFKPISILKNRNNSANLKFGTGKNLIFGIEYDHFIDKDGKPRFNLTMVKNGSTVRLETFFMSVENNEVSILVNYDTTIECGQSTLVLDLSQTKYTPQISFTEFNMCGDNEPLQISEHWQTFLKTEYIYTAFGILIFCLLLVGLCTPKFIGLEAILTLQLIFYSCFLITDVNEIPVGFKTFTSFKFSTGYNDIFTFTNIFLNNVFDKKVVWMGLQKTIIENYNISFGLLILSMILMIASIFYRRRKEEEFDGRFINFTKGELQKMQLGFCLAEKINLTLYNLMSHISFWSIFQVIAAFSIQVLVNNKNIEFSTMNTFFRFGPLILVLAISLIFITGLNNFKNVFLSDGTWSKLSSEQHMVIYKQIKFVYLILMGTIILLFNQVILLNYIPISVLALLIHLIYMGSLIIVQPYKTSLNIHKYGLFICQLTYFIFLLVVNLANFLPKIDEMFSLIFVYFIVAICVIIVIFTVIRLYYEYKYGSELEIKIQKQRQIEQLKKTSKEEAQMKKKLKKIEDKIQQRLEKKEKQRLQNKFLIQNQIRQDLMNDEIEFLNNRPNITEEKKEILYFEKFQVKPMSWLQKHNFQEYSKVTRQLSVKKAKEKIKRQIRETDPEYIKLTNKLRKQFFQLNK